MAERPALGTVGRALQRLCWADDTLHAVGTDERAAAAGGGGWVGVGGDVRLRREASHRDTHRAVRAVAKASLDAVQWRRRRKRRGKGKGRGRR